MRGYSKHCEQFNGIIKSMKTVLVPNDTEARYEFRTFGQDFAAAAYRMARLSEPVPERFWQRQSQEVYVVCGRDNHYNIKLRNALLDIKSRIQISGVLEQWKPVVKAGFPVSKDVLKNDIFSCFPYESPPLNNKTYTAEEFLEIAKKMPDVHIARVHKERHGYRVNGAICEVASVLINGARLSTISVESPSAEEVMMTLADIGINDFENINYVEAIKRVIGVSDLPFVN